MRMFNLMPKQGYQPGRVRTVGGGLGALAESGRAGFKYRTTAPHEHAWLPGDGVRVCSLCGLSEELNPRPQRTIDKLTMEERGRLSARRALGNFRW